MDSTADKKNRDTRRHVEWTLNNCYWRPFRIFSITHENDGPDEWHGYTEHHWVFFGKLGLVVRVPLSNWTPPTDEKRKAAREARRDQLLVHFLMNDGTYSSVAEAEKAIAAMRTEDAEAAAA